MTYVRDSSKMRNVERVDFSNSWSSFCQLASHCLRAEAIFVHPDLIGSRTGQDEKLGAQPVNLWQKKINGRKLGRR